MGPAFRALLASIATVSAGCGRFGFDLHESTDGGPGGSGSDGGPGTGLISPDAAAWDSDGGISGCLAVDTDSDEDDRGESPGPPHQGSGLSLREAILLANQARGADCIRFARPLVIAVATELPSAVDADGLTIDGGTAEGGTGGGDDGGDGGGGDGDGDGEDGDQGDGDQDGGDEDNGAADRAAGRVVQLTGPGSGAGLRAEVGPFEIRHLEITGFATGVVVGADDGQLGPGLEVHACGAGILVTGARVHLRGVHSRDHTSHGIEIAGDDADLVQVLVHDNRGDGVRGRETAGLAVRHATIAFNGGAGIDARGAAGATVRNTIVGRNGGAGVAVDGPSSLAALDHCDFFDDTCEGCALGAGSIDADPLFADVDARLLTLQAGSPCIDRGVDTGADLNGAEPGRFGGVAPDLGAFESR